MKKVLWLLPVLMLIAGCGKVKTGTIACTLSQKDAINNFSTESTYNINYEGKYVTSVDTKEIVTSDSEEMLDLFVTELNKTYSAMDKEYGGYKYSVVKKDGKVTSTVTINYNKMDLEGLAKDTPALAKYIDGDKIQVEGIKGIYESLGAGCK